MAEIPGFRGQLRFIEQLPDFDGAKSGQSAFLEGTMSEKNSPVYHKFIVYLREAYQSSTGRTSNWTEVARQTPSFILEVQGRAVRVVNEDYALKTTDVTLEEATPTMTRGAVQARGFVAGSSVFAIGRKHKDEGFIAEFLYAGTRSDYVAYLSKSFQGRLWFGGGILFAATLFIVYGGWQLFIYIKTTKKVLR